MDMNTEDVVEQKPRGRREKGTKQDAVIETSQIGERIDELVLLYKAAERSGDEYAEAIKAAAEKSGLLATVVRRFVAARANDKAEEKKREASQLVLLFDEVE